MKESSPQRVTMRTLAEQLGVTKTTISLALRGHSSISAATREKVVKLAKQLNYRPDPAISAIAAKRWSSGSPDRHRVIAFFVQQNQHPANDRYFKGAQARAEELGFKLEAFSLDNYTDGKSVSRVLHNRGIRGVIIPSILNPRSKRAIDLDWNKFTAVCCGIGRVRPPLHTVVSDQFSTTRLLWEVAAKAGYTRIGAALYQHDPVAEEDWQRIGASKAAVQLLNLKEASEIPILTSHMGNRDEVLSWYRKYKPEVIIGFNHMVGESLESEGVRIPEEVQFVGLFCAAGTKWSGITHHYNNIGRAAMDLLNGELRENRWGLPDIANLLLIPPEWNIGSTFSHAEFGAHYTFETTRASGFVRQPEPDALV